MIALKFSRPYHDPQSPNVTVRKSSPEYQALEPGESIRVEAQLPGKGVVWADAMVLAVVKAKLVDLDGAGWEHFLKMEHDPIGRTFGGLVLLMESSYGEPISMKQSVVCICYQIDPQWANDNWPKRDNPKLDGNIQIPQLAPKQLEDNGKESNPTG